MTKTTPEQNKAIVLEAFETLFNTDQLVDVRRIDIRDFGQCGRRKRRASILADQTGNVIPPPAFKNGNCVVFHRRKTQESPG